MNLHPMCCCMTLKMPLLNEGYFFLLYGMEGKMFFLLGVSGSGKWTLTKWLLQDPRITKIPSYTTRSMREWEVEWENYHFITAQDFSEWIHNNEFLEYARPHDLQFSGTKRETISKVLQTWQMWLKEVDIVWREQIKKSDYISRCKSIRLDIPLDIMESRIRERWPMSAFDLEKRQSNAIVERAYALDNCDYIINSTQSKEKVLQDVKDIIFWIFAYPW